MTRAIVRSAIPGRIRLDVPVLLDKPDLAARLERILLAGPQVKSVAANSLSGRVLLHYGSPAHPDSLQSLDSLQAFVETSISDVLNAPELPSEPPESSSRPSLHSVLGLVEHHKSQALYALGVAFADRMFEAAPSAMIGVAADIVTRGSGSILGRLGLSSFSSQFLAFGVVSALVWIADAAMGYWHTLTTTDLANEVQNDLRNKVYQHLQSLDIAQLESRAVAEWLLLLRTDTGRIAHFIEEGVDPIVTMATNGITVAATFLLNSPALAALQLLMIPGLSWVSTKLLEPIRRRQEVSRAQEDRLSAVLLGNVTGMSTISSFSTQPVETQRVSDIGRTTVEASHHTALVSAGYVPGIQLVVGAGFLTTLIWGGRLVKEDRLSVTVYNVMSSASLRLFSAVGRVGMSIEQYQRTLVSFDRILKFLQLQPTITSGLLPLPAASVRGEIVFEDVEFSYVPGQPVLRKINLIFAAGSTTGIVGATGAGKSTIQKLISRFYDVQAGSIRLDGTDIRDLNLADLRQSMSVVPQQIFLFDGTIRENIAYARPDAGFEEIAGAARAAQAHSFISSLPDQYDSPVGENGNRLSGGQQQRLAIARAVLADRPIMLFDEATSAVDFETEAAIQRSLAETTAGRTTIIVAHRLSTVRRADRIYVLEDGNVFEHGTHDELLAANGLYASMWRIQTGESAKAPVTAPASKKRAKKPKR